MKVPAQGGAQSGASGQSWRGCIPEQGTAPSVGGKELLTWSQADPNSSVAESVEKTQDTIPDSKEQALEMSV